MAVVARPLKLRLPDPDDAPFLEVALAARADALITGNLRHYPTQARQGMAVLDPASFVDRWSRQSQR